MRKRPTDQHDPRTDVTFAPCERCDGRGVRQVDGHWFSCSACGENGYIRVPKEPAA